MKTGPSMLFVLVGPKGHIDEDSEFFYKNVIQVWKEMMGPWDMEVALEKEPDSLRARYGDQGIFNVIEGSRDQITAYFELFYFFRVGDKHEERHSASGVSADAGDGPT